MERRMSGFGTSENSNIPSLCINNYCGFYGNPVFRNLCSKCYADYLKEELVSNISMKTVQDSQQESIAVMNLSSEFASKCCITSESVKGSYSAIGKDRCVNCKKKVGLLGFKCRCGGLFCGKHRHPEEHGCVVDMKAIGRQILAKQIVECKADRLQYRI